MQLLCQMYCWCRRVAASDVCCVAGTLHVALLTAVEAPHVQQAARLWHETASARARVVPWTSVAYLPLLLLQLQDPGSLQRALLALLLCTSLQARTTAVNLPAAGVAPPPCIVTAPLHSSCAMHMHC